MKHLTLGIHYPKKGESENLINEAAKIAEMARQIKGCVDAGVWKDENNERIIVMSLWENPNVAIEASKVLRPQIAKIDLSKWESQPSDNMVQLIRQD